MERLLQAWRSPALRSGLLEFGPLLVFWGLLWTVDLKIAIGVGVVLMLADAAYRRWRGLPITRLYLLSSGLTLMCGCIDLFAQTPFWIADGFDKKTAYTFARSAGTTSSAAAPSFSWQQSNRWNGSTIQRDAS